MGKGLTGYVAVKGNIVRTWIGETMPTSLMAMANSGSIPDCGSDVSLKSPVLENCTLGSVRGMAGNRHSYRAD